MNNQLEFDDASHIYTLDGKPVASVTTIMREEGLSVLPPGIPFDTLARAADRGKRVHAAVASGLSGTGWRLDDAEIAPYVKMAAAAIATTRFEPTAIEAMFYRPDCGGVAGTLDLFGHSQRYGPMLIDIKTSSKSIPSWRYQIQAYDWLRADNNHQAPRLFALWVRPDKWEILGCDDVPVIDTFCEAASRYNTRTKGGENHG